MCYNSEMDLNIIKSLRQKTGLGLMEIKEALAQACGNEEEALRYIMERQQARPPRPYGHHAVFTYNHNRRIAAVVVLGCGTDFAGNTDEFIALGEALAQQVVGADPADLEELLHQDYIKDPARMVRDLIGDVAARTGETIGVVSFERFEA